MGRTGKQSIRKAGATILLALLCAVSFAPSVQALDSDPPPFLPDYVDNAQTWAGSIGQSIPFSETYQTAVLFKSGSYWYLYIGEGDDSNIRVDEATGDPIVFYLRHYYTRAWLVAFNSDGTVNSANSTYNGNNSNSFAEHGISPLSESTAPRTLISCSHVAGNFAGSCPTTPFPYTTYGWNVPQGEAPPEPECEEGYTGTYPDCELIPTPPEEPSGTGMTQQEFRELLHEYAIKGAAMVLAVSVASLIIYSFRWHPRW